MRTIPITAAALVILSTAASAQMSPSRDNNATTPPPRTSTSAPATTSAPAQRIAQKNPLTQEDVSLIEGTSVYGGDDGKVGHISHVLMEPQSKKIDRLVVSAGGMLGIGSHRVAIPVDQFSWDADRGVFKLSTTLASLKEQPEWVEGGTMTGSSAPPKKESAPSDAGDGKR